MWLPCAPCHNIKTWLNFDWLKTDDADAKAAALKKRFSQTLTYASKLKKEKWQKQKGKCGNDKCPMGATLERGQQWVIDNYDKFEPTGGRDAVDLFLMFYTQFEHIDALMKLFSLASIRAKNPQNEIRDERSAKRSLRSALAAFRLKTML